MEARVVRMVRFVVRMMVTMVVSMMVRMVDKVLVRVVLVRERWVRVIIYKDGGQVMAMRERMIFEL